MRQVYILLLIVFAVSFAGVGIVQSLASDWPTRAQIGDSFGLLNALYSALAFAGLVYAILLQRQELGLQREAISQNRKELAKAAESQELAAKTQRDSALLNTYTALLTCKNSEISESLRIIHASSQKSTKLQRGEEFIELTTERSEILSEIKSILLQIRGSA